MEVGQSVFSYSNYRYRLPPKIIITRRNTTNSVPTMSNFDYSIFNSGLNYYGLRYQMIVSTSNVISSLPTSTTESLLLPNPRSVRRVYGHVNVIENGIDDFCVCDSAIPQPGSTTVYPCTDSESATLRRCLWYREENIVISSTERLTRYTYIMAY